MKKTHEISRLVDYCLEDIKEINFREYLMETAIEIRPGRFLTLNIFKNSSSQFTTFFIHGLGGRADQWREQIKVLRDQHTLIIPHILGHGSSQKPKPILSNPYSFYELDQDLAALFNQYRGKKNIILGHSYGGVLATSLAKNYQNEINKLVLFNPAPCQPRQKTPFVYQFPVFLLEMLKPFLNQLFLKKAFDKNAFSKLLQKESSAGMNNKMYVIKAMIEGMKTIKSMDLSKITIPTLIVMGETDGIFSKETIKGCYHYLPHHQFKIIKNTAHLTMLEKPKEVNQLLVRFLEDSVTI